MSVRESDIVDHYKRVLRLLRDQSRQMEEISDYMDNQLGLRCDSGAVYSIAKSLSDEVEKAVINIDSPDDEKPAVGIVYPKGFERFIDMNSSLRSSAYLALSDLFSEESRYHPDILHRITLGLQWLSRECRWPKNGTWEQSWNSTDSNSFRLWNHFLPDEFFSTYVRNEGFTYKHGVIDCPILEVINRFVEFPEPTFTKIINTTYY